MNRRTFIQHSAMLGAAGFLTRSPLLAQATGEAAGAFYPLRRNVGYFSGRGGTIGWLVDPAALAVVDTQFPGTAAFCLEGLPGRSGRTLDVVINTHHHRDHTSGNPVFKPAARTLVAQTNVPGLQLRDAARNGTTEGVVVANETFDVSWRREMGGEVVTATYFGAAHTNGDAVVHFERANVVHMGDLVFNRLYPVIDRPAGASIRHWITVLDEAVKKYPGDAIYIFGHGSAKFGVTGSQADLPVFRDYLSGLLDHVEREIANGKSKAEITALANLPGFPDFHSAAPNRLQGNLAVAYDELTTANG
ncbi:MAG: MBL fold metallo-hydrolase [Cephaloticoccus sp.]|nr:MBL fold metallo-hydrolase [Cephaloticoccus sp.]MCF7761701.1 MBL fold metallo-hydrolase [Cephaloticoccus sp.]